MNSYEVAEPILNSPFEEPGRHWYIRAGEQPDLRDGRRPSVVFPPRDQKAPWVPTGILQASREYQGGFELAMVNLLRERVKAWRKQGYPGVTRTTLELLEWWQRAGRERRLFF